MTAGSGYSVQQQGLGASARTMGDAASDLQAVLKSLPGLQCSAPAAFGGEEAAPAYDHFVEAWHAEGQVLRAALEEISKKLGVTANNYQAAEQDVQNRLNTAATTPFG